MEEGKIHSFCLIWDMHLLRRGRRGCNEGIMVGEMGSLWT
jgi:hypothetical protein